MPEQTMHGIYFFLSWRASVVLALQFASSVQEQFPVLDRGRVANEHRHRKFLRCTWHSEQLQAGFARQTVSLALVYFLSRPDQVLPGVLAAARAGHDVVQAALIRTQHTAR